MFLTAMLMFSSWQLIPVLVGVLLFCVMIVVFLRKDGAKAKPRLTADDVRN